MNQIPFNVSARAAMLIGRENIASSKGAIIELVKNCYDADSPFCIIYIDNKRSMIQEHVSREEKDRMIESGISLEAFEKIYLSSGSRYLLNKEAPVEDVNSFRQEIQKLSVIYIIDSGDGMTQKTIVDNWMTIGTDNKLLDYETKNKRVKSGAKGIGRFALDKLGSECTMTTIPSKEKYSEESESSIHGSVWKVNWRDFEGTNKTIDKVTAYLDSLSPGIDLVSATIDKENEFDLDTICKNIVEVEKNNFQRTEFREQFGKFQNGTILKISKLNDYWSPELVGQVFKDLEILIPPRDLEDFRVYLASSLEPRSYGEILGPDCEDFDYKVEARANDKAEVEITIYRDEYDLSKIPKEFFLEEKSPAVKPEIEQRKFTNTYAFSELLYGLTDAETEIKKIGPFGFTFYFLKRSTTSKDSATFFHKDFNSSKRKVWLDQFSGIKIYRDNFRVRPYGEVDEAAFDWLGLGLRQAASPAGVAKLDGGYKVRPENIAGSIKISRLTNLEFSDKSSREGLQETKTLKVFKNLIISIISKFEEDRSSIAKSFSAFKKGGDGGGTVVDRDTERLAKKIIQQEKEKRKKQPSSSANTADGKLAIVARYAEEAEQRAKIQAEENERLLEEQKLLRGLASSGIVAASFGHDLSKTKESLNYRFDELIELLSPKVNEEDFKDYEEFYNPFEFIKGMKKEDRNIAMWLGFSLGFTKKDKRKRKQIYVDEYFQVLRSGWLETLTNRGISLMLECPSEIRMRVFEIDFDSIFLNLLVNSIEAFKTSKKQVQRKILIKCYEFEKNIIIEYRDSGPGLPSHLKDPNIIFEAMYTTKRDSVGQEVGTGLGMWIIKVISDEYQADARLLLDDPQQGFGIAFHFPQRYR